MCCCAVVPLCRLQERVEEMFKAMDKDKSGDVTLPELLAAVFPYATRGQVKVRQNCGLMAIDGD